MLNLSACNKYRVHGLARQYTFDNLLTSIGEIYVWFRIPTYRNAFKPTLMIFREKKT